MSCCCCCCIDKIATGSPPPFSAAIAAADAALIVCEPIVDERDAENEVEDDDDDAKEDEVGEATPVDDNEAKSKPSPRSNALIAFRACKHRRLRDWKNMVSIARRSSLRERKREQNE